MNLPKKTLSLVLAAASVFASGPMANAFGPGATPPAATGPSTSDLLQMANTKLATYVTKPPAEQTAIYNQIARFYVQQQKKSQPDFADALETYLLPNEKNKGEAMGQEVFGNYVQDVVTGQLANKGITGSSAAVYGSIKHVGDIYLGELQQKAQVARPTTLTATR